MKTKLIAILVVQLWLGATRPLWAQSSIAPYLGMNRGGESACRTRQNCEDKLLTLGAAIGPTRGFEEDLGPARDVFGKPPDGSNRPPDGSKVFVLSGGTLITRVTPNITALFAPDGNPLKFWRGTFRLVVSF